MRTCFLHKPFVTQAETKRRVWAGWPQNEEFSHPEAAQGKLLLTQLLQHRTSKHCALQKSVARFLRACLALLLFLVSFADGKEREEYVQLAWSTIMKILTCLILCSVADVAKTLLAKLLSSHFHKRAHFDKMQDALNKVKQPTWVLVGTSI